MAVTVSHTECECDSLTVSVTESLRLGTESESDTTKRDLGNTLIGS